MANNSIAIKKSNRCQCCYKSLSSEFHLVFGDEGKKQNIAALLFDYIGKSLNETNVLRYAICDPCWKQLIQYNEFKQKCLRANEELTSDNDNDDNSDGVGEEDKVVEILEAKEDDEQQIDSFENETVYEDSEYLDEFENNSDYEYDGMNVEYLYETDSFDEATDGNQGSEKDKKKIPFDFTAVLVKPIFAFDFDDPNELARIKQKISKGVPRHSLKSNVNGKTNTQHLDVQKIATSDDLINILEDDYRNETTYAEKNHVTENNDEVDDAQPVDVNEYLKTIASINYVESYENYINCMLCSEVIMSQQHLVYHINEKHSLAGGFSCIFDENCSTFEDLVKTQEHIFQEHADLIPTQLILTCSTCENSFKSSVQFGKHMCMTIEDESTDLQCVNCDEKLKSKKRYLFHTQFHLDNARPKVCIICELSFEDEENFYNHMMFSHERVFEYFCEECDKSFSSNIRLELHIRTHHTERTVQCGSCDKTFVDKSMLDEHISSKHSARAQTEKSLECPVCKRVYNRSSRLRKHMTTHERLQKNSVFICESCSMAFGSIEEIDDHCNRLHDDDNVNIIKKDIFYVVCCEYCECAFVDNRKLVKHKADHLNDDKPFKCGFCMACYETYSKLKTHKNTHINQQVKFPVQRNYLCDVEDCWKRYRHWSDLLNHRKTVHLINPSIYKCNDCEQTFYQSWNFSYHKKTAHTIISVKCKVCKFECKTMHNLKVHQRKHHASNKTTTDDAIASTSKQPQQKTMKTKKTIEFEQYLRKSDTALVCNICGKSLATRNSARAHIEMTHMKIKNFSCEHCGKEFYLKKDFIDHQRLHTAETPYECKICSKKFRTASMLNDHRKSHSNNRPHSCPFCASTFKRAYVLKNHIKQHIGIKGFPCPVVNCNKEYRTQWELNSHQRLKHSKAEPTIDQIAEPEQAEQIESISLITNATEERPYEQLPSTSSNGKTIYNRRKRKNTQQIIYVMPGPIENVARNEEPNDNLFFGDQLVADATGGDDHTYLATANDTDRNIDSNVIYLVDQNVNIETLESSSDDKPTTILVCNQDFSDLTIMDVGAIQTIDQDAQANI